jgi:Carbon storage regulator (could also regulate swarming and quorum sensing)
MSLVLSLKQGDDFWVGNRQVVVSRIQDAKKFWLSIDGKEFEIVDTHATEILPDVFVASGDFFKYGMVRVAIDAPREIEILRGDRYRARQREKQWDFASTK